MQQADTALSIRSYFKRFPRLYYAIVAIFGPVVFMGESPVSFLRKYQPSTPILNIGSGPKVIREDVINVDSTAYPTVQVVADVVKLPHADASVGGVIIDNVFEHVDDPLRAIKEVHRILKPGGVGYFSTPFLYPFHPSPDDFQRWTTSGLRHLLRDFEVVEIGPRSGMFSTLTVVLVHLFAGLFSFGSDRVFWSLSHLFLFVFFPIKYLDFLVPKALSRTELSAVYYVIFRKLA